jgi:hypothetical protein
MRSSICSCNDIMRCSSFKIRSALSACESTSLGCAGSGRLGLAGVTSGVTSWKLSEDSATDSSDVSLSFCYTFLPTRDKTGCISCRSAHAGDALGNLDVCQLATKFACPGDGGAMGDANVCLPPSFFGIITVNTTRPLRKIFQVACASSPDYWFPSCAMLPTHQEKT